MNALQKTSTAVHSMEGLLHQRAQALAKDQCALSGVSLYGQLIIGAALYLYQSVSTPGYLSILLTLPFLLLLSLGAWKLSQQADPEKGMLLWALGKTGGRGAALGFALIFWLDSQLAAYVLTAMMQNILPNMSTLLISVFLTLVMALTISGGDEYALHRLTRFLRWAFLLIFAYCALTALPYGHPGHLFPLLGHGPASIFQGALWMCGCVAGACCPLVTPQSAPALSCLCEKRRTLLRPLLFALVGGALSALLSAYLLPVYALARPETLGWRMLLITHVSPSLAVWSLFLCGQMFLMLISQAAGVVRAAALITWSTGTKKQKPFLITLLLLFQIPACALDIVEIEEALRMLAPWRGALALLLLFALWLGGSMHRRKEKKA